MSERIERTHLSVSDHLAGALMCLHGFLSPEQRKQLPNYPDITNLCQTIAASRISASFIHQSMGIQLNEQDIEFLDEMKPKINKIITDNQNNWQFYIDGFSQTGKSTIASLLVLEMLQILSCEKKMESLFFYPINWQQIIQRISDVNSVYNEVITATINQLTWQAPRIFPFSSSLLSWFLELSNAGVSPELPSHVKISEQFPTTQIEKIGRNIVAAFKEGASKIGNLLELIISLPMEVSFAFGFKKIIYIFDHLDLCNFPFSMENETERSEANFLDCIISIIKDHQFVIAPKNDGIPLESLKKEPIFIDTTNFITETDLSKIPNILIDNPFLELKPSMCHGCPQLLHRYNSIVKEVRILQELDDGSFSKLGISPTGAIYQRKLVAQLIAQFCFDLENIGNEEIYEDLIFEIQTSENITITIPE